MTYLFRADLYRLQKNFWVKILLAANAAFASFLAASVWGNGSAVNSGFVAAYAAVMVNALLFCALLYGAAFAGGGVSRRIAAGGDRRAAGFSAFLFSLAFVLFCYLAHSAVVLVFSVDAWAAVDFADFAGLFVAGIAIAAAFTACFILIVFWTKKGLIALAAGILFVLASWLWAEFWGFAAEQGSALAWPCAVLQYFSPFALLQVLVSDWRIALPASCDLLLFIAVCLALLYRVMRRIEL